METPADVVEVFLQGAQVVLEAVSDWAVAEAWDRPAVLEDQLVSGLAGHLVRSGVWVVAEYADAGIPDGPVNFTSAAHYFHTLMTAASSEDHQAIRKRGADFASPGHDEVQQALEHLLEGLGPRLRSREASQLIAVTRGEVMRLGDYLTTRIVEQVVHLDDLARSVKRGPWSLPPGAGELTIAVGIDIAILRGGNASVIRALYRRGHAEPLLPVI